MFCVNCGEELHGQQFCTSCGTAAESATNSIVPPARPTLNPSPQSPGRTLEPNPPGWPSEPVSASNGTRKTKRSPWLVPGIVVGVIALIFVIAVATPERWTKVDVPAQAETFHSEKYETGNYNVSDNGISPCWVGQDWYDCINMRISNYNSACAEVPLTTNAKTVCQVRSDTIDEMQSKGGYGWTVTSVGSQGTLTRSPEIATKKVSNNDARPAVTHDAVCYLGFIGECPQR